jgi:SAM-dependent methyltransferase
MPFPDADFDVVVAVDIVETLPIPEPALRELARVLRPGGVLICNIPGPEDEIAGVDMQTLDEGRYLFQGRFFYQFLSEKDAVALLTSCGLRVRSIRVHSWIEPAHPNFREIPHTHTSRVFLAERSA